MGQLKRSLCARKDGSRSVLEVYRQYPTTIEIVDVLSTIDAQCFRVASFVLLVLVKL